MPDIVRERAICDGVANLLARSCLSRIRERLYPEDWNPQPEAPVDAVYLLDNNRYVVEHSILQTYTGQIAEDHKILALMQNHLPALAQVVTVPGRFVLGFHVQTVGALRTSPVMIRELTNWVGRTAATLSIGQPGVADRHIATANLPDWSFSVSLERWPGTTATVQIARYAPADTVRLLRCSFRDRIWDNAAKLETWSREYSAETVLILESQDEALFSNADCRIALAGFHVLLPRVPRHVFVLESYPHTRFVDRFTRTVLSWRWVARTELE